MPLQQASWLEPARQSMQDILGSAVCWGLAGQGQPGEADCVLCPRRGGVGGASRHKRV